MTPRRSLRAALAATAVSLLALTGCSAGDTASNSSASSVSTAAAHPLVAASSPSSSSSSRTVEGDAAVVVRVIDGDTVDVRKDGDSSVTRVRLLNIDTPETKHPSKAVQCMGPEATRHLESLLAAGDRVTLQYDLERFDKYHRTLAGVFEGTTLVNAEIARAGLGVPVVFEPNRRFYPEVLAAWNEAKDAGAGLNQSNLPCSLPVIAGQQTIGEQTAEGVAEELALAYAAAVSGDQEWMQVLYKGDLPRVKRLVESHATLKSEAAARENAERRRHAEQSAAAAAARNEAAQRQAERDAAQEEAEREAAARAEQAEQEAEAARAAAAEEESSSSEPEVRSFADTSGGSSEGSANESSSGSSGGSSNKAPNRCYAPGGETFEYCDDQDSSSGSSGSSEEGSSASSGGDGGPVAGSGGVCPEGYPVKVSSSGKYHVPGGQYYDVTSAKNCYASTAAAASAGFVASKR